MKEDRNNASNEITKMREAVEKGLDVIEEGMVKEKLAHKERLQDRLAARKNKKIEAAKQEEEDVLRRQQEAAAAKEAEIERVKELRVRKEQLEKTLKEGQKLMFAQCYSRPLYRFNAHLNEMTDKNGDYSWLNTEKKAEFKRVIMSKLLDKVTQLEQSVEEDMNTNHIYSARGGVEGGMFSDTASNISGYRSAAMGLRRQSTATGGDKILSGLSKQFKNKLKNIKPKNVQF